MIPLLLIVLIPLIIPYIALFCPLDCFTFDTLINIILVDKIRDEICNNDDPLSEWVKQNESQFSLKESSEDRIIEKYADIITSVQENIQYKETAKLEFARVADSWLCAHALAHGYIILTQETFEPNLKNRVKIPNVCKEFDIDVINLLDFMRRIGIRFD